MTRDITVKENLRIYAESFANAQKKEKEYVSQNAKRKYILYVRKSTKGDKNQERSIPDQIKACTEHLQKLGIPETDYKILQEEESAKRAGQRDRFTEMLELIKKGTYNSICAWHPDRLARNMKDAGEIIDMLDNLQIYDLQFPSYLFTKDSNGIMALGMQFVLAKQYSDNLSLSSTRGSINIALEGKAPNHTKYGYFKDKNKYMRPDGASFIFLQEAFKMALNKVPFDQIADFLNESQFKYKGEITQITKQKLSLIFKDPFYAGLYVYSGNIIDMKEKDPVFTPMISAQEFLKLRHLLNDTQAFKNVHKRHLPLREMIICAFCGNKMSPSINKGETLDYLNYWCTNKKCKRYIEGLRKRVRAKVILDFIYETLSEVKQYFETEKLYKQYVKDTDAQFALQIKDLKSRQQNLNRQLQEKQSTLKSLTVALGRSEENMKEFIVGEINTTKTEIDTIEEKLVNFQEEITSIEKHQKKKILTYENFLNLLEKIDTIIRHSSDVQLVDDVTKLVFLNFSVGVDEVLSYQPKSEFEESLKNHVVMPCRGGET